jgi:hypothetical protein
LDTVGHKIWQLLEAGKSAQQIVAHVLDEYEVEAQALADDVAEFLDQLTSKGLIRILES